MFFFSLICFLLMLQLFFLPCHCNTMCKALQPPTYPHGMQDLDRKPTTMLLQHGTQDLADLPRHLPRPLAHRPPHHPDMAHKTLPPPPPTYRHAVPHGISALRSSPVQFFTNFQKTCNGWGATSVLWSCGATSVLMGHGTTWVSKGHDAVWVSMGHGATWVSMGHGAMSICRVGVGGPWRRIGVEGPRCHRHGATLVSKGYNAASMSMGHSTALVSKCQRRVGIDEPRRRVGVKNHGAVWVSRSHSAAQ
ncbi:hypothetical protein EDB89DRAFT_1903323 [Lactarius sanguifluus]|nr:hypothetical protein EDB89DRAFT_1903323 [Lactarius sanguifluus]